MSINGLVEIPWSIEERGITAHDVGHMGLRSAGDDKPCFKRRNGRGLTLSEESRFETLFRTIKEWKYRIIVLATSDSYEQLRCCIRQFYGPLGFKGNLAHPADSGNSQSEARSSLVLPSKNLPPFRVRVANGPLQHI